jgi:hypothetical protein
MKKIFIKLYVIILTGRDHFGNTGLDGKTKLDSGQMAAYTKMPSEIN